MTATQVQFRRGTQAQNDAVTFPEGEAVIDLTNDRWRIHDGVLQGGYHVPNHNDQRFQSFNRGTVGGTGNAITITMSPANTSYATGMTIKFIAAASNTGSTTVDVDGLGTRNIQKMLSGSLSNLAAGDIVSGGVYEISYDGTQFQLLTLTNSGLVSVSQGDLNTSTGTFSASVAGGSSVNPLILGIQVNKPGGEYGFDFQSYVNTSTPVAFWLQDASYQFGYANYARAAMINVGSSASRTLYGRQRYINSSPPYDLGDGEVGGFFFALVNGAGEIVSTYIADTPPWAYNGPTDIRCSHKCPVTGKKFRRVMKKRTFEEIMDGASIQFKMEEITHEIKNADMELIPHPFGEIPSGHSVVLLDPMDDKIRRIIEYQNAGGYITESFDKISIDNDKCKRCGPKGVSIHKMKYKFASKF